MATVPLTPQTKSYAGLTPTFTPAGGIGAGNGFVFDNPDGKSDFRIKNASASPVIATIKARGSVGGVALADQTVSIPATTGDVTIGNLDPAAFGSQVTVEVSASASVTAAVLR
ncbi:MAG: hypothetical protein IPK75_17865 [Acidobacteria bacterium]|nr:hypothetical protein [Acidobacteriota bacterium]